MAKAEVGVRPLHDRVLVRRTPEETKHRFGRTITSGGNANLGHEVVGKIQQHAKRPRAAVPRQPLGDARRAGNQLGNGTQRRRVEPWPGVGFVLARRRMVMVHHPVALRFQ